MDKQKIKREADAAKVNNLFFGSRRGVPNKKKYEELKKEFDVFQTRYPKFTGLLNFNQSNLDKMKDTIDAKTNFGGKGKIVKIKKERQERFNPVKLRLNRKIFRKRA